MKVKVAERLLEKGQRMKEVMKNTKMGFMTLEKDKKADYKMQGLYSYNLLDHPDFIRASRIEKRIIRFNMKNALKQAETSTQ